MGTRSTTKLYEVWIDADGKEKKDLILALYKQYDGYIEGWGKELKEFINSGKFVNGLSMGVTEKQFNGLGDFALQLVTHFKTEAGGLYATTRTDKQEYNYIITYTRKTGSKKARLSIECKEDKDFMEFWDFEVSF